MLPIMKLNPESSKHSSLRKPVLKSKRGFILILTLVLIALVTILMVVVSILARIERRASYNEAKVEQARQNAIFALNTAVAQLQREAGPDQRVTARADILSNRNQIGQPYWTGVWKTYDPNTPYFQYLDGQAGDGVTSSTNYNIRKWSTIGSPTATGTAPDPTYGNMVWLVSGGTNNSTINPTVTSTATWMAGSNSVVLAQNLAVTGANGVVSGTTSVNVPLVPIVQGASSSTPIGHYGYWVSDEGVKAKINEPDPTFNASATSANFVQNQLHFMTPQGTDILNGILGAGATTDIRAGTYATDLPKVTTLQSLGLVGVTNTGTSAIPNMTGTGASYFSPDATTYSRGVLADVANGGLKTDLSQVFEDPSQFQSFVKNVQLWQPTPLTWAQGDAKAWSILAPCFDYYNNMPVTEFGPRWQSLYNYYSLYKNTAMVTEQQSPASPTAPFSNLSQYSGAVAGTANPELMARVYNYNSNPAGGNTSTYPQAQQVGEYYVPHVLAIELDFSMASVETGTNWQLLVYAEPRLVLYNPYNVTLTNPPKPFQYDINSNIFNKPLNIGLTGDPVVSGTIVVNSSKPVGWNGFVSGTASTPAAPVFTVETGTNNLDLKPGEIKVVGLQTASANTSIPAGTTQSTGVTDFDGSTQGNYLGGPVGSSQYSYIFADSSTGGTKWTGTCSGNDQVNVSVGGGSYSSNAGFYNLPNVPPIGLWPINGSGSQSLGRFFNSSPNLNGSSQINLGSLQNMKVSSPSAGAATAVPFFQFLIAVKGMQLPSTTGSASVPYSPVFSGVDGGVNPMPVFFDNTIQDINVSFNSSASLNGGGQIQSTQSGDSFWGQYDAGSNPNDPSFLVLHDIPRQPMISLGQFMHASFRNSMFPNAEKGAGGMDTNTSMWPVGGSLADPFFPLTQTYNNVPSASSASAVVCFDDNYLMNRALFDSYFFSTIPPPAGNMDSSYSSIMSSVVSGSNAFTAPNIKNGTAVLPNSRIHPYWKNGIPPVLSQSGANNLTNYLTGPANIMLDGAFNINSTSIPAWAALLSSLSGNSDNYLSNGSMASPLSSTQLQNPIFRVLSLTGTAGVINSSSVTNPWAEVNSLTNQQVLSLATQIVNQVKQRGPFLSMADFLNRRLDSTTGFGSKGALQAAIDTGTNSNPPSPLPDNNAALLSFGHASSVNSLQGSRGNHPTLAISSEVPANTVIGAPGYLMQQDIVQCFSPLMTARSDTFVVRCYGEADNQATGQPEGKAWCEAVVQRVPDFLDQTDLALTTSNNSYSSVVGNIPLGDATPLYDRIKSPNSPAPPQILNSASNYAFGRRFKVVSFRWLNETDL